VKHRTPSVERGVIRDRCNRKVRGPATRDDLNVTGKAYRVPVRTGSIAEVNAILKRATSADEVKEAFRKAASSAPLKGVMDVLEEEWASARIVGDPHSSIIDLPLIQVQDGALVSVAAWYDNEMGYSARLAETAAYLASHY
jgi:glyceraldehyde 3-phosphate dehydrogenase